MFLRNLIYALSESSHLCLEHLGIYVFVLADMYPQVFEPIT